MTGTEHSGALAVRGVETDDELAAANDLMAKVHCSDYFYGMNWLKSFGAGYPGYLREHTRIALWNGELAGSLRLNTETIRIGEARLKMGGLGWVTTAADFRHRGVARALLCDAITYMKRHGYHVSMLFGIPNFYHRFGFTASLAEYGIRVAVSEALTGSLTESRMRDAKPGDIPALQKMHHANDAGVACSLMRSSAHITNKWEFWNKQLKVLTTDQGRVIAYVQAYRSRDELTVAEVGVAQPSPRAEAGLADREVCGAILSACARMAGQESVGAIRFLVPPPHPFARFLLSFASTHEMHVTRDSGGMMAFVDLAETLESMIPEWENLLQHSSAADMRTECVLSVDRVPYRVRAHRGAIDVAAKVSGKNKVGLSAADLMHMVTGARHVEDILSSRRRILTPEARQFLTVLFPRRYSYVWQFDRF